jgi:hypothetical protein
MRINGHDAEIGHRTRTLFATLADGSTTAIEVVDASRVTAGVIAAFAKKHVTAVMVTFFDLYDFRYPTPWEMSYTRGRVEVAVKFKPDGTVISRERRHRGY